MKYPNWQSISRPKHILLPLLGTHSPPLHYMLLFGIPLDVLLKNAFSLPKRSSAPIRVSQVWLAALSRLLCDTPDVISAPAGPTPGLASSIPSLPQTHPFLKVNFHLLCEAFPINTLLTQEDFQEKVIAKQRHEGICLEFSLHNGLAVPYG